MYSQNKPPREKKKPQQQHYLTVSCAQRPQFKLFLFGELYLMIILAFFLFRSQLGGKQS